MTVYLEHDPEVGLIVSEENGHGELPMDVDKACYDRLLKAKDELKDAMAVFCAFYAEHKEEADQLREQWYRSWLTSDQ